MNTSLTRAAFALLISAAAGCGPIGATSVIADAEVAAARAHASDGDKLAPYETTSADLYLQKAREEQGRARYDDAKELARTSIDFSARAAQKAAGQRGGAVPVAPQATIQHAADGTPIIPPPMPAPSPIAPPGSAPAPAKPAGKSNAPPVVADPPATDAKPAKDGGK